MMTTPERPQLPKLRRQKDPLSRRAQWALLVGIFFLGGLLVLSSQKFFYWLGFESLSRAEILQRAQSSNPQERASALAQLLGQLRPSGVNGDGEVLTSDEFAYLKSQLVGIEVAIQRDPFSVALVLALLAHAPEALSSEDLEVVKEAVRLAKAKEGGDEAWRRLYLEGLSVLALSVAQWSPDTFEYVKRELFSDGEFYASSAAFALGLSLGKLENGDPLKAQIQEELAELLQESAKDMLRYNAAFALARVRDARALSVIDKLLREALEVTANDPTFGVERFQLYTQAFASATQFEDQTLRSMLVKISEEHPHLRLRQAAKIFVKKVATPGL